MSLPGIGQKRAQNYLERFQTAAWVIAHLTQDEKSTLAKSARRSFGLEEDQFLAVLLKGE